MKQITSGDFADFAAHVSPDGKWVFGNLWSQPIDGGPPKQITKFTSDLIPSFAVSRDGKRLAISRDGKRLAISRGSASLDVVLIKDFR